MVVMESGGRHDALVLPADSMIGIRVVLKIRF